MSSQHQRSNELRCHADLIQAATRHAHALRKQAIDDALSRLAGWLRRPRHAGTGAGRAASPLPVTR